jgi:hypothetical protein
MPKIMVIRGVVLCAGLLPLAVSAQAPGLPSEFQAVCDGLHARRVRLARS